MNVSRERRPSEDPSVESAAEGVAESESAEDRSQAPGSEGAPEGAESDAEADADTPVQLYVERLQRMQAEFENYRRRSQQDLRDREERTVARVFQQLLPVVDDLRLAAQSEQQAAEGVIEGLRIILDKVSVLLGEFSIEEIPAVGEPFDPRWHEAMIHQESRDASPGEVIDELERGYRLNDRLVRPSRVIVAKQPTEGTADADV